MITPKKGLFLFFALFILINSELTAQWQSISINTTSNFSALNFLDENNGIVCGTRGEFYRTTNGGITWSSFNLGQFRFTHNAIEVALVDINTIIVVGYQSSPIRQQILRSIDGGQSWTSVYLSTRSLFLKRVQFISATEGMVVGDDGLILKTTDGGATWIKSEVATEENLSDLSFLETNRAYAVGQNTFLRTTDGGATWEQKDIENLRPISNVAAVEGTATVYASNGYQVAKSEDAGDTWSMVDSTGSFYKEHLQVIAGNPITSNEGLIHTSNSQGVYWERQVPATNIIINNFQFLNEQIGYLVGTEGVVYKTTNGGGTGLPIAWINKNTTADICQNETVILENLSDPTLDFQWLYNGQVYNTTDSVLAITFSETETQRVSLVVSNGAFSDTTMFSVYVNLIQLPEAPQLSFSKTKICQGEIVRVQVRNSLRDQIYELSWGGVPVGEAIKGNGGTLNWTVRGILNDAMLELVVIKEQLCGIEEIRVTQPIEVAMLTNPNVTGSTTKEIFCPTDSITVTIHNSIAGYEYEVRIDSLLLINLNNPIFNSYQNYRVGQQTGTGGDLNFTYFLADFAGSEYAKNNTHSIYVQNDVGCNGRISLKIESKVADFNADFELPANYIFANTPFSIDQLNPTVTDFNWDFGENAEPATATTAMPQVTFLSPNYQDTIRLYAKNEIGCADTIFKPIFVHQPAQAAEEGHCDIENQLQQSHLLSNKEKYTVLDGHTDKFGHTYISGAFKIQQSPSVPKLYLFLLKFDENGQLLWEKTNQNTSNFSYKGSMSGAISTDSEGNVYWGGSYAGSNRYFQIDDFKFPLAQNSGVSDNTKKCFVFKLNQDGKIIWAINSYQINGARLVSDITDILVTEDDRIFISYLGGSSNFHFTNSQSSDWNTGVNLLEINKEGQFLQRTGFGDINLNNSNYLNLESETLNTWLLAGVGPRMALKDDKIVFVGSLKKTVDFGFGFSLSPIANQANTGFCTVIDLPSFTVENVFSTYQADFEFNERDVASNRPTFFVNDQNELILAQSWETFEYGIASMGVGGNKYIEKQGNVLMKYDLTGQLKWHIYNRTPAIHSIVPNSSESFLTYGEFKDFLSFGDTNERYVGVDAIGETDLFLAAFDSNGNNEWATVLGSQQADKAGLLIGGCAQFRHFSGFGNNPIVDGQNLSAATVKSLVTFSDILDCESTNCSPILSNTSNVISSKLNLTVSPNPFHNQLSFQLKGHADFQKFTLQLYNVVGYKMSSFTILGDNALYINTNDMPKGIYFYSISTQKKREVVTLGKIIRQ